MVEPVIGWVWFIRVFVWLVILMILICRCMFESDLCYH